MALASADPRFAVAGGTISDMTNILGLAPGALGYGWGSAGWTSAYNVFMVRPPDPSPASWAASHPGSIWLMGNEPDKTGQDNKFPSDYAQWFKTQYDLIKGGDSSAKIAGPGISHDPNLPTAPPTPYWIPFSGNPYWPPGGDPSLERKAYMWDVLKWYMYYYQVNLPLNYLNFHAYGGAITSEADKNNARDFVKGVVTDWQGFWRDYDANNGTSYSSLPMLLTEFGYDPPGQVEQWARDFIREIIDWFRLVATKGAGPLLSYWFWFICHDPGAYAEYALHRSDGTLTFRGEEYNKMAYSHFLAQARAASNLTLSTANQDVPGCSVTLDLAGKYLIRGVFDFSSDQGGGDNGQAAVGDCVVGGAGQGGSAICRLSDNRRATVTQDWVVDVGSANVIAKLQARKTGGSGASAALANHTEITALRAI